MSDSTEGPSSGTSSQSEVMLKRAERMKKLRELHMKRNEASRLNHKEVVEEHRRSQLPDNWEKKQQWIQWKVNDEERRAKAADDGVDYDRVKLLDVQSDDADRWERKRQSKKNVNRGFSDFETATALQYQKLTKQLKPDMDEYERTKQEMGDDAFYATRDTLIHGTHRDTKEGINRMVEDLNKQIDKRNKFSRRRPFDDDADIDYINERNMKFNKKLDRFYGSYTTEIKQNLERGTAV